MEENGLVRIIRLRAKAGGQKAVAEQLGVSQATVSRILSGQRGLGRAVLNGVIRNWPELTDEALDYLRRM